jgi:hypothetical protein
VSPNPRFGTRLDQEAVALEPEARRRAALTVCWFARHRGCAAIHELLIALDLASVERRSRN